MTVGVGGTIAAALVVIVAGGVEPGGVIDVAEAERVAAVTAVGVPPSCGVPAQPVRPANSEHSSQRLAFGVVKIPRKNNRIGVLATCFMMLRR